MSVVSFCAVGFSLEVLNPNYQSQEYARYSTPGMAHPRGMTFGPDGSLYVGQELKATASDGVIYKIAHGGGSASVFAQNLNRPRKMTWVNSPDYGNYLYFCNAVDMGYGEIRRIDTAGNMSTLVPNTHESFTAIGWDITATQAYGGALYTAGTRLEDVYEISPLGSLDVLSTSVSGDHLDLNFDPTGKFNNKMYIGVAGGSSLVEGIFTISPSGAVSTFSSQIYPSALEFDSMGTMFGFNMCSIGYKPGTGYRVWMIDENANDQALLRGQAGMILGDLAFGPDGALYVATIYTDTEEVVIDRISLVPEPASFALMALAGLFIRKRK